MDGTANANELVSGFCHLVWTFLQTSALIFGTLLKEKWQETTGQLPALRVYLTTEGLIFYSNGDVDFDTVGLNFPSEESRLFLTYSQFVVLLLFFEFTNYYACTKFIASCCRCFFLLTVLFTFGTIITVANAAFNGRDWLELMGYYVFWFGLGLYIFIGLMPIWLHSLLNCVGGLLTTLRQRYQQPPRTTSDDASKGLSASSPDGVESDDHRNVQGTTMVEPARMHRTAEDGTGTGLPVGTSGTGDDDNEQGGSLQGIHTTTTTTTTIIPTITATTTGNIVTDGLDTARNADDEDELQGKDNNDNVAKSSSVEPSKESWNPVVVYTTNTADEHLASQVDTTTGGVGTAGISTPKNAADDDAKSFWGHMNTMLPETTKNPVVENSTNNKNNVQSVSRSHPSPFTAASRSAESPACTIPEVVVPGKSGLLLSPLSNVFSPTKNKATNRFANVPGAVENDRSLASDDVSFTESEAKRLNPSHDSRSNGSSIITTTTSCNGKLGARARVQVGILKTKDYRRQDYDSVLTGDTATQQSYGTNPINDMLYTLPRSIPNVEMANPQHGPSLLEIAKWGDDDEDSDIVSNPKSSVEEESARRPRMTGDVAKKRAPAAPAASSNVTAGPKTTGVNENGRPDDALGISPSNGRTINHNGGGHDDDGREKGNDAESTSHKSLSSRLRLTKVDRRGNGIDLSSSYDRIGTVLASNTARYPIGAHYESQGETNEPRRSQNGTRQQGQSREKENIPKKYSYFNPK